MISNLPGVGTVNDAIAPGQPGGPPATVATGASGDIPIDPGQSTALPSVDPTAPSAPINVQPGVSIDPTTGLPI